MFFGRRAPQDGGHDEMFGEQGRYIGDGARAFLRMVETYADEGQRRQHAAQVAAAERAADRVTAELKRQLQGRAAPASRDREQAHALAQALDDILDLLLAASEAMSLYDLRTLDEEARRLADIGVRCCERVTHLVTLLPRLKEAEVAESALKTCEEIDRLESDADRVLREGISHLFREEPDVRELIKRKAIYEHLEAVSDRCEDVADLVQALVLQAP